MKIAVTLAALALSVVPAFANGCHDKVKEETAASCMPGYVWDAATATCTAATSS